MASGDSNDDLNWRAISRWTENCIVYRRKTHRKAQKTFNNTDVATTTATAAENPIAAGPTPSTNKTPIHADVESASVEATPDAGLPSTSTSEDPKTFVVAPPTTIAGSPARTTSRHRTAGDHDVQESFEGKKDADLYQGLREHSPHLEQCLSHGSPDKNAGLSHLQVQEQLEHRQRLPLVVDEVYQSPNRVPEGNGADLRELQDPEVPQLPNVVQASDVNQEERRELSPLSCDNDLPNGREGSRAQLPIGNKTHNEVMLPVCPQVSQGNGPVNVNGVVKLSVPQISALRLPTGSESQNDGEMMSGSPQASQGNTPVNVNGVVKPLIISSIDDRIRFNLCRATSKNDIKELWKDLVCNLDRVKTVVEQLESRELQLASYNTQISNNDLSNSSNYVVNEGASISAYNHTQPLHAQSNVVDRRFLVRVSSEVGAMGHQENRPMGLARVNSDIGAARNLDPRLYSRQLSVAVMENNNRPGDFVEKEKRTPKANQYYRNSEFLLGKDRLPSESNKRLKTSNGRKHNGETEHNMGVGLRFNKSKNPVFRSCSSLLRRLMKHRHGWVFNAPVNANALNLFDYHDIIKHPMDLGTIKTRLSQNRYKSPREFAEDVRLVFHNAKTYNPKGQDVHFMAEELLQIFEEGWTVIESEYITFWRNQMRQDGGLSTPTSRMAVQPSHFAPASLPVTVSAPLHVPLAQQMGTSDRPEPMASSMAVDHRIQRPHAGRAPAPKKPKAKDPNKRDMTYDEKQRLSTNLQSLPAEKLDAIVQIIKKRNAELSQNDDEIEVDIDSVDAETLWELDRFVTNYKKSLSKNKRKAELALQARTSANQNVMLASTATPVEVQIESVAAFEKSTALADGEKRGYAGSKSSSSSSSSSDSGSSSSDTDSDSSSGDGSDAEQSPKT